MINHLLLTFLVILNSIKMFHSSPTNNTFNYFAYGSNLLSERIHINNPSAERNGIGRLENYRLDFVTYAPRWHGAVATIVPTTGTDVWGAIWRMKMEDMKHLDDQEGVKQNMYQPIMVEVNADGKLVTCRTYIQTIQPKYFPMDKMPIERLPSPLYLKTILNGAKESMLPEEYVAKLEGIKSNEYNGSYNITLSSMTT